MSRFIVVELNHDGSDNRPLGRSGEFLVGPDVNDDNIAKFTSSTAALDAARAAKNGREGCTFWVNGGKQQVAV